MRGHAWLGPWIFKCTLSVPGWPIGGCQASRRGSPTEPPKGLGQASRFLNTATAAGQGEETGPRRLFFGGGSVWTFSSLFVEYIEEPKLIK